MKSIIRKTIIVLVLLLVFVAVVNKGSYAQTVSGLINSGTWDKVKEGDGGSNGITQALNSILGIVQIAGTGIALITVSITGIRYMLASVDDKAQAKNI
jgi:outer membrane protease